jgi:hypothetical protein
MAITAVAPAHLDNGAESDNLEDVTHSCVQCGTTLTRTIRLLTGDAHTTADRLWFQRLTIGSLPRASWVERLKGRFIYQVQRCPPTELIYLFAQRYVGWSVHVMPPVGLVFAEPDPMITGNRFRVRADECLRAANSMADPERKLAHLDLAQRWLRLATQIDKMDAETRHDTPLVPLQAGHP